MAAAEAAAGSSSAPAQQQQQQTLVIRSPLDRKQDVFDAADFDPTKFINQIYPDEASLGDLDRFIGMLKKQIKTVDKEIFSAVRSQSNTQARSRQDLSDATAQMSELFKRVKDIQQKAADSEVLVQEICRDIRKLDYAKRHLTHTITSLRRLAMLTAAVDDLEQIGHRRDQYKRCANLLEAVSQLLEHFNHYQDVPKMQTLTRRLSVVQRALQDSVLDDFKLLLGPSDVQLSADNTERLASACMVVNALGPKVRDQLMDWLCEREMAVYQTIFSMSGDAAKLDRFERRFAWFNGRLEERKEVWGLFPAAWRVPQVLCLTFCKITKAAVKRVLSDSEEVVAGDVGPLLKAVVATNKFEREMAALFGGKGLKEEEEDDGLQEVDNMSASEARRRLEAFRKKQQAAAAAKQQQQQPPGNAAGAVPGSSSDTEAAAAAAAASVSFEGAISEAFGDSLKYYVAEEQKERVLSTYAGELLKRLPKTAAGGTAAQPPYSGTDWHVRLPDDEEDVLCSILATAEYCRETTEGLGRMIARELQPPVLADQLDLSEEESAFTGVASQCLSVLVLGINTHLDACLQDMLHVRWDAIESPGDDSPYVGALRHKLVTDVAPRLGAALDKTQFSFFCDKMGRMFVPRFIDTIYKLRKASEKGTIQLSIDTDSVRRLLLEFPKAARPLDDASEFASYAHHVEREMGGAINLVKVLQAKPENLVDTFILLMPPASKTQQDLARVCELKGFTKKLQSELTTQYLRKVCGAADHQQQQQHPHQQAATPFATSMLHSSAGPSSSSPNRPMGPHPPSSSSGAGPGPSSAAAAAAVAAGSGLTSPIGSGFGGLPPSGGSGSGAASNLSALKMSVNSFTRELASSMSTIGRATGGAGSGAGSPQARAEKPTLFKPGGLNFNMQQTAARTREGLAKISLPFKLPGGGSGDGQS